MWKVLFRLDKFTAYLFITINTVTPISKMYSDERWGWFAASIASMLAFAWLTVDAYKEKSRAEEAAKRKAERDDWLRESFIAKIEELKSQRDPKYIEIERQESIAAFAAALKNMKETQ